MEDAETSSYSLCGQFVQVALPVVAPHDHPVNTDEISAGPALAYAVRLGAQEGEIPGVVDLQQIDLIQHWVPHNKCRDHRLVFNIT